MEKKTMGWLAGVALLFLLIGYGIGAMSGEDSESVEEPTEEMVEENEESEEVAETLSQDLEDWMPRLENVVYHYEGFGNEYASFKWTPQFNQEDYYQMAVDNGGTTVVEIYQYNEEEIVHTFSRPETYFRDHFNQIGTIASNKENEVILKTPIAVGTKWSMADATYEITATDKEISVPAGEYTTIEVTTEYEDSTVKRYYADGVGLIYEWTEADGLVVESKLKQIETDTAEVIPLTIYQADDQALGLDQLDAEIKLMTNDPARIALQELFLGENEAYENIYLLPTGTEINYLFLNEEDIVEVDLSSEYITNMNAGSSGESFYLTGLGNTLSQYYGVEKVLLTIDGENYEGGHILLGDDEYLMYDDTLVNE